MREPPGAVPAVDEASVLRARSRPLAAKLLVAAGMALAVAGCVAVLAILVALLAAGIADNEGAAIAAALVVYWIAILTVSGWLVTLAYPPNARRWGAPIAWAILFPPVTIVWLSWLAASKSKWVGGSADAGEAPRPVAAAKVCPECAEEVKAAARVCRFCGHRFEAAPR